MYSFSSPTKIIFGAGAIQSLASYKAKRAFLVTDGYFSKSGLAREIANLAAQDCEIFDEVQPDPSLELVARGTAQVQKFDPDVLIALGGGSVLDTAKAMGHFSGKKLPLIAIPTTSGSGSEVTDFAILTHNGVKHPLVDPALAPVTAILDSDLLKNLPKGLIADAGYDVLSHALEALVGTNATPFTHAFAKEAFSLAFGNLPASFGGDVTKREAVHAAATMSAIAFNQAGLGICHALAHTLGGRYHVPHGRLNAILLPAVVSANAPAAASKYAALARAAGLGGSADTIALRNLKNALVRLRRELRLPGTLAEAGVAPEDLRRNMDSIIQTALADPCCKTNPVVPDKVLLWQVLEEAVGHG